MARRNEAAGSRVKANLAAKASSSKPQPKAKKNGFQLPEKLPAGEILTDVTKSRWRLGKSIGVGGFGEIYAASNNISRNVGEDAEFVIKIEPHENGPLFTEMHFYMKAGKAELIEKWKTDHKQKFLGMPRMFSFGSHVINDVKYRFMVMDRFGIDVQKIFEINKNKLSVKSAFSLAIKLLDVLEYIHSTGYVHADIKGSNLLLGFGNDDQVYLVDYGLACKYMTEDKHKAYEEDPRKAHDGTIEFTSRDAHVGAHSRRGDMEILGYNVAQWLCSQLPWEDNLRDPERVHSEKIKFMKGLPKTLNACFNGESPPDGLLAYLKYVNQLDFEEQPDYSHCKKIFVNGLAKAGFKHDNKLNLKYKTSRKVEHNQEDDEPIVKRTRSQPEMKPPLKRGVRAKAAGVLKPKPASTLNTSTSPANDVPTPAMLQVMQQRQLKTKLKSPVKSIVNHNNRSIQSDSDNEQFYTPPTTRRAAGRKRGSSELNSSHTPELF